MSEIWNLSAICRCCHTDGNFKSLRDPYMYDSSVEIYSVLLQNTFGVVINPPPFEASYTICEECIRQLRAAFRFKHQVLECEQKFEQYCKNELALGVNSIVKYEDDAFGHDDHQYDAEMTVWKNDDDEDDKNCLGLESKKEHNVDVKSGNIKKEEDGVGSTTLVEVSIEGHQTLEESKPTTRKRTRTARKNPPPKIKTGTSLQARVKTGNSILFSCKQCGRIYKTKKSLREHNRRSHENDVYKCEHCMKEFKKQIEYKRHLKTHNDDHPFKCQKCFKKFTSKRSMVDHQSSHSTLKENQCELCQKMFAYRSSLTKHLKWHNGTNKTCICDQCGHSFNDRSNLKIHILTVHDKIKRFKCNFCPKQFAFKKHLVTHIRSHTGERPYPCDLCEKRFTTLTYMKQHREIHQYKGDVNGRKYVCKVCHECFNDRGRFRSHVRSHVGHLPHKCDICAKDFSCKYSLKRHVEEHGGLLRYSCDLCGKRFKQKTQVDRHKKNVHDPNKAAMVKVKCDLCKKNVYDLEKHRASHVNRPYPCHVCGKCYAERSALNRHVKVVHVEKSVYHCELCNKRYVQKKSLKEHKLRVHKTIMKVEAEENFDNLLTAYAVENKNETS